MTEKSRYLFCSERIGFRNWQSSDLDAMDAISADPTVMRYFPTTKSRKETVAFIARMQEQYTETGHCYFAVDHLENQEFFGFIGLSRQSFEADFTPCVDIGWRLSPRYWNQGLATEGANASLNYAHKTLTINDIYAIAPCLNIPSIRVMEKIGMHLVKIFDHPLLPADSSLKRCVLYLHKG